MGSRGPPSVHAEQKAMEVTKTSVVDDFEPGEPDEKEELSQGKQKRARETNYAQKEVPPPSEGYGSDGEDGTESLAPTNASVARANVRKDDALYWAKIAPDTRNPLTAAQKESAIRITVEDLATCCAVLLTRLHEENEEFPDHFEQAGATVSEGEHPIKGLNVAFASSQARAAFIQLTNGAMQVSTSEDADDDSAQVVYTIKVDSSQPEMAYALLRKQSARLVVYTKGAPFKVPVSEVKQAVQKQMKGVMIVYNPRRGTELDANGKPLRDILGPKPEVYMRVGKSGDALDLPRVLVMREYPFRYKVQKGYFTVEGKDLCNGCHQHPCECDEIKKDVTQSNNYKKDLREKKNKARQAGGSSSGDLRSQRLEKRGNQGKAVMKARTDKQKRTPCTNFWDKGSCKFGDLSASTHTPARLSAVQMIDGIHRQYIMRI